LTRARTEWGGWEIVVGISHVVSPGKGRVNVTCIQARACSHLGAKIQVARRKGVSLPAHSKGRRA